ncbi:MAG: STAS/SEC14 domain-containing protein [Ignavibacteriaceae bacterium]
MNFKITISESGNYVIAKVYGEINREIAQKLSSESEAFAANHNIKRALVDVRECRNTDTVQANIAYSKKDVPFPRRNAFEKMANLVSPDDTSHSLVIVELANEGYNIAMFTDEQEAIEWLEK